MMAAFAAGTLQSPTIDADSPRRSEVLIVKDREIVSLSREDAGLLGGDCLIARAVRTTGRLRLMEIQHISGVFLDIGAIGPAVLRHIGENAAGAAITLITDHDWACIPLPYRHCPILYLEMPGVGAHLGRGWTVYGPDHTLKHDAA